MRRRGVCFVSYGSTEYSRRSEASVLTHYADAIRQALERVGLHKREIQGLSITTQSSPDYSPHVAEQLGLELDWVLNGDYGGAGGVMSVRRAADAIEAGHVDLGVVVDLEAEVEADAALDALYAAEAQLRRLMGLAVSDGAILRPADDPVTVDFQPAWDQNLADALARRPELRRQKWSIKGLELQLRAAENLTRPRLDFVSSLGTNVRPSARHPDLPTTLAGGAAEPERPVFS